MRSRFEIERDFNRGTPHRKEDMLSYQHLKLLLEAILDVRGLLLETSKKVPKKGGQID